MRALALGGAVAMLLACRSSEPAKRVQATRIEVRVDRRIELIATLGRLVGEREYVTAPSTKYVADVDRHFKPFSDHPAVTATRELRRRSITYDAPIHLAVRLGDDLTLRMPVDDPRFAGIDVDSYLATVRDFAAVSKFDEFFAAQQVAHEQLAAPLRAAIDKENPTAWFDAFFGAQAGARFIAVASPLCGRWNFGPRAGDEIYQVIGLWKVDFDGRPIVDDEILELVVHELAHSYINPLFAKHRAELQPHGERMFARVAETMTKQSYGQWDFMLYELGVRTIVALYLHDRRGAAAAERAMKREVERSFTALPQLAELIRTRYVARRGEVLSFDAFMPELIAALAEL